ncbi:MAG: histidinol-phosphate transaminase [Kiritimatiellia bacterium]
MKQNPWIKNVPLYEPGRPLEEVARELGLPDVTALIKTASNENELGPSPKAIVAIQQAAANMHRYPDGACFYLKQKLARKLDITPENILFGNGSNEIIEFLGHTFLGPDANMVVSETAFVVYRLVCALFQATCIQVPMRDFTHDLDAMRAAITPATRIITICNPNNPTGTSVQPKQLTDWLETIPTHVLIVVDEAYVELMPIDKRPDLLALIRSGKPNLMILRTFSKAYGLAGLRLGYAIAHPTLITSLNHARQPFNVNAMAQAGGLAALDDDEHLARSYEVNMEGIALFERFLTEAGIPFVPTTANFVLMKTGHSQADCKRLLDQGIIARPMQGYGLPEWIRLTIGTPEQNAKMRTAILSL